MNGYLMLKRAEETIELLKNPLTFGLLTIIAVRARRTDTLNVHNLQPGEALIGDFKNYGLTQKQYRNAKKNLKKWNLAAFKGTSKGTIATLLDTRIYDINVQAKGERRGKQGANKGRTGGEPGATNNKGKNANNENNEKEAELFQFFKEGVQDYPGVKRGVQTEYDNFRKKHSDWKDVCPLLSPLIGVQIMAREKMLENKEFVPPWKHFATYINNRCWETEIG